MNDQNVTLPQHGLPRELAGRVTYFFMNRSPVRTAFSSRGTPLVKAAGFRDATLTYRAALGTPKMMLVRALK